MKTKYHKTNVYKNKITYHKCIQKQNNLTQMYTKTKNLTQNETDAMY